MEFRNREDVAVNIWTMLPGNFPNKERVNYLSLGNKANQIHEVHLAEKLAGHILCPQPRENMV